MDPEEVEAVLDELGELVGCIDGRGWQSHEIELRSRSTIDGLWRRCGELGIPWGRYG